jgi:multidrug resistance efflux pump
MIHNLKKRPRPDTLVNEKRASHNSTGRVIYLGALAVFALTLLNYLLGDMVFFRADGLALRDQTAVAVTNVARVESVHVTAGQLVEKDQPLFTLQSTEMLERIADLSARRARLVADSVEFHIRSDLIEALLPLAKKRETEAVRVVTQFDKLANVGLTTSSGYDSALTANFNAQQDRVKLTSQLKSLQSELTTLQTASNEAKQALEKLRSQYADGKVIAPVTGSIGVSVPSTGHVYRVGEPILSIYSNDMYILAYLPRRYLFSVEVGMNVSISDGHTSVDGVLTELLSVTDAFAKEFQSTFKPTERSRLAKISLVKDGNSLSSDEMPFPLNEKVTISTRYF